MDQKNSNESNEDNYTDCDAESESAQCKKEIVKAKLEKLDKKIRRGIIYLSTIPKYMNVAMIRETFSIYGKVGRVYLQLVDNGWSKIFIAIFIVIYVKVLYKYERTSKS